VSEPRGQIRGREGSKVAHSDPGDGSAQAVDLVLRMAQDDKELAKELMRNLRSQEPFLINDIWHADEGAVSFWILLLNGINRGPEAELAQRLLVWKEFFSRSEARIRCIQSSENEFFHFCAKTFDVQSFPVLIISDRADFANYLRFDEQALKVLIKDMDRVQQFLTGIHSQLRRGTSVEAINADLRKEQFWHKLSIAYKEIKDLLSVSIQCKVG
jgi:hypothetical protein